MKNGSKHEPKMFQVATLQSLALGYTKPVVTVKELLQHGDTGLGTYKNVDGEMILAFGECYRADENGAVTRVQDNTGVPFSAVSFLNGTREFDIDRIDNIASLKILLNNRIEEDFGLNSMHMVRIDGEFSRVYARSESAYESQHVELKEILRNTQKDFTFEDIDGSLVCVYFPDYMDGINAAGWHFHFISADRKKGGHVFEIDMIRGHALVDKIGVIEIRMPDDPAFDTYSLKEASGEDIKKVEQG